MKFLWCCIATVLVTITNGAVDVEKTVKQVQNILQANSLLPRLSREEILQLMNDIKAEDERSSGSNINSKEITTTTYSTIDNEINPITILSSSDVNVVNDKGNPISTAVPTTKVEVTTKGSERSLTVVLPYTPRDGSSLQELYTRPPRVEVVPESFVTPKPVRTLKSNVEIQETLKNNAKLANKQKQDLPAELQEFLDAHGLIGKPGQDNFLLPLEGFKPLPPARIVDGTVQLPENILLAYDLISPTDLKQSKEKYQNIGPNNFLYEPLRPELPFELDTSSSEIKEISYPYEMPKRRKPKSTNILPNYEPIDYDSVKVIPLDKGVNPLEDIKAVVENEQSKRQTNTSSESSSESTTTTTTEESKNAQTAANDDSAASAGTDSGASIADLEDSFGGAAPQQPGDSQLPPPRKNGFYWLLDWNSFLEVGDGDTKVNIRLEPKLGDPQMFLPVTVP